MNNTIKKLDRKLLKMSEKIINSLDGYDPEEVVTDELYNKFVANNHQKLNELEQIASLRKAIKGSHFFTNYKLLKKYLEQFEFTMLEQAEVVAYYFNLTLKYILNIKIDSKEFEELAKKV